MISEKDVIRMKVPFPDINADLAVKSHMYICRCDSAPDYGFVKCQSFKPSMIGNVNMTHYICEPADSTRNPFEHESLIDCDKFFVTKSVTYDDGLKTTIRPDICSELFIIVVSELEQDGYKTDRKSVV